MYFFLRKEVSKSNRYQTHHMAVPIPLNDIVVAQDCFFVDKYHVFLVRLRGNQPYPGEGNFFIAAKYSSTVKEAFREVFFSFY